VSRLRGPDGYHWTVQTALAVVARVLDGAAVSGFQTPSRLFGADFVLAVGDAVRQDEAG
jgi:hypothetical protein